MVGFLAIGKGKKTVVQKKTILSHICYIYPGKPPVVMCVVTVPKTDTGLQV